ncbi:MAG: HNH endonuclease [Patescibacteria group bacterium]|nr:HNH endonuclease [Patescibacteria group bacterium]
MDKQYQNKSWLYRKYVEEEFTVSEIAQVCGVNITTVSRWAAKFEIREIRPYEADRKGENNPYWKGGKYKDSQSGYVMVYLPEHKSANKKGYVPEHRLVMENFLGRPLKPNETVRHKNKRKDDNKMSNLELVVLGEPEHCAAIECPFCEKKFKMG